MEDEKINDEQTTKKSRSQSPIVPSSENGVFLISKNAATPSSPSHDSPLSYSPAECSMSDNSIEFELSDAIKTEDPSTDSNDNDDGWGRPSSHGSDALAEYIQDSHPENEFDLPLQHFVSNRSRRLMNEEASKVREAHADVHRGTDTYQGPTAPGAELFAMGPSIQPLSTLMLSFRPTETTVYLFNLFPTATFGSLRVWRSCLPKRRDR